VILRVPATSANLGSGFDVLGMALSLEARLGCGDIPLEDVTEAQDAAFEPRPLFVDEHHPAMVAFRRGGGTGPLWVASPIPMGRGLGYSAAMRIGGLGLAALQRHGPAIELTDPEFGILAAATELEGHGDNAAPALHGGVVVVVDGIVQLIPLGRDPTVVLWVPKTTTSTATSRRRLVEPVSRADAVFNLGRVALLVAALAAGDSRHLDLATQDRLHQPSRLVDVPESAAAIEAARAAGAWGAWLSGSGPTVACWCAPDRSAEIVAALPPGGRTRVVRIAHEGAVLEPAG
jgi:homoserine kinase